MALIQMNVYSAALHTNTSIQVILPTSQVRRAGANGFDGYDTPRKFPVLYLLHGTYGDATDYLRFSRIESYAQRYELAVVMADAGNGCYRNMPRTGAEYWDFMTEELPKMMRWMFPVSDKREETFLCGLSMGANGAFKIGMTYPERYGAIACMSAKCSGWQEAADREDTVWSSAFVAGEKLAGTAEDMAYLAEQAAVRCEDVSVEQAVETCERISGKGVVEYALATAKRLPELYFCVGKEDRFYQENKKFMRHLDGLGIPYTFHEQSGDHDWDFWDDELRRILVWLPIQQRNSEKRWF